MTPNTLAALFMMGSMAAFTLNDTCVKVVGSDLPLFQIVTLRGAVASVLIYIAARHLRLLRLDLPRRDWVLIAVRSAGEASATYFFLTALMHMPLANVTAVIQALPLTVTLGAALFLGEPVGWRRMTAIGIGLAGVLLIVRPGPDGFSLHAIYALAAVFCVTLRDLVTRHALASGETDEATWQNLVTRILKNREDWVVQRYVDISQMTVPSVNGDGIKMIYKKYNLNPFVFAHRYAGSVARLSDNSVINVSAGGGLVPVVNYEQHVN